MQCMLMSLIGKTCFNASVFDEKEEEEENKQLRESETSDGCLAI